MPAVAIRCPGQAAELVRIDDATTFGRSRDCDVQLKYPGVSRSHARLEPGPDGWLIRDLGSRSGTRVDGSDQPISEPLVLSPGDSFWIGEVMLTLVDELVSGDPLTIQATLAPQPTAFAPASTITDPARLRDDYEKLRLSQLLAARLASHDPDTALLEDVLRFCVESLQAEAGALLYRQTAAAQLEPVAVLGADTRVPGSVLHRVLVEREGLLVHDASVAVSFDGSRSILESGDRSLLAVPVLVEGEVLGVLFVRDTRRAGAFVVDDLDLLVGLAGQLAQALERRLLRERLRAEHDRRRDLSRFLPGPVIAEVEAGRLHLQRRGALSRVTVLFSDIRGFTTLSSEMDPAEVFDLLNGYFAEMVASVFAHGGTVDKYMGDGLIALWGAPEPDPRAGERAIRCALEMQARLQGINAARVLGSQPPIEVGIGIHTGDAAVGLLGAPERVEYTAIGDTVNTASRLCGQATGGTTVVTLPTLEDCAPLFRCSPVEQLCLRGRPEPIQACRVLGRVEDPPP